MKKAKILFACAAIAAMLGLPTEASAQSDPVVINGSLINWYSKPDNTWEQVMDTYGKPSNYGLISLTADPSNPKKAWVSGFPIRNHVLFGSAGAVYTGDAYYTFTMSETGWESSMDSEYGSETYVIKVRKWTWDGVDEEGNYTNVKYEDKGTMGTQPLDLTYDPFNDVVYGIFYNGSSYKIGTLDLSTLKVTYISREGFIYGSPQCIAVNSKGELYAIDASGYVYSVSKTDGTLTTIGHSGVTSQALRMSATFDFRTDKLYWIGFMNNGKKSADTGGTNTKATVAEGGKDTGLYEVDTTTGVATLIKKLDWTDFEEIKDPETGETIDYKKNVYGKLQMTGIYVDGSFTKPKNDLRCFISECPNQKKIGDKIDKIEVVVKNLGSNAVGADCPVYLYINGTQVGDALYLDDNLQKGVEVKKTFRNVVIPSTPGIAQVTARVEFAADENQDNNTSTPILLNILSGESLPTPVLSGQYNDEKESVILTWTKPDGHVMEGAEEFMPFTYDGLNDWTMVDGDKAYTGKPNNTTSSVDYPNWSTPKAFIVMDPVKAGLDLTIEPEKFAPHSGTQYFAGFWSVVPDNSSTGYHEVDNDDYMVSPKLNGEAQTVSFWAKSWRGIEAPGYETDKSYNETLEVLYTTQDIDMANIETLLKDGTIFQVIKETFSVNDREWEQYSVELPAGAKYFALHRNSKAREQVEWEGTMVEVPGTGSFMMMIDDIEFKVAAKEPTGYKVYANGMLSDEVGADVTSVASEDGVKVDFHNEYFVTAVYNGVESGPSNIWSVSVEEAGDLVKGPDVYYTYKVDAENGKSLYMLLDNAEGATQADKFHDYTDAFKNIPIGVGIDGTDIYIKGLSLDKPNAWIKGTLNGSVATFPAGTFIGHDSYMSAQSQNAASESEAPRDIVFAYDTETKTLTLDPSLGIIENNNTQNIGGVYAYWDKLVIYRYSDTDGISDVRSKTEDVRGAVYDLYGRKVDSSYKGIVIQNGRKFLQK